MTSYLVALHLLAPIESYQIESYQTAGSLYIRSMFWVWALLEPMAARSPTLAEVTGALWRALMAGQGYRLTCHPLNERLAFCYHGLAKIWAGEAAGSPPAC